MGIIEVKKDWGVEYWMEVNPQYTVKELVIKKGQHISYHYHEIKHETFYIKSGAGYCVINGKRKDIEPGYCIVINPRDRHTIFAVDDDIHIIETSTTYLTDSIREELEICL